MDAKPVPAGSTTTVDEHQQLRDQAFRDAAVTEAHRDGTVRSWLIWHLLRIRNGRGLSQRSVAKKMKTTQSAISELEKGNTDPRLSTLQRYARAVGAYIDVSLVERSNEDDAVWRPFPHLRTWRNRTLPYDHNLLRVRIEKDPQKIYGTKLAITADKRWRPPSHTRNPLVSRISVSTTPDDYLRAVTRG